LPLRWLARLDAHGLTEVLGGLVELSLLAESNAQVVVRLRVIGQNAKGFGEVCDGLVQFPLVHQRNRQVRMRLGIVGPDPQSLRVSAESARLAE